MAGSSRALTTKVRPEDVSDRPLSPQQDLFCREYVKDLNASAAYVRAKYSAKGANTSASKLLADPRIRLRVQELAAARLEKVETEGEVVLRQLGRIANADIRRAMSWGTREYSVAYDAEGKRIDDPEDFDKAEVVHTRRAPYVELRESADIDDDTAAAIEGLSITARGDVRFKMAPKTPALHLLARIHGLLSEDIAVHANVSFIIANGPPLPTED